jgi:teichuronic acid exporter
MANLGTKAKLSVLWNTGFNLFRDGLQFFVMLVLVRMISPSTYGVFALLSSVMTFIHVFSFNTFIQHVLQVREDSKINYQNHFTFGFFLQVFLFFATNIIAFLLYLFDFYSAISLYLHVLSFVFFFELFSELYRMQLQRELDWKRMRILHGIGLLIGSILSIIIAYNGGGIYALILPGFFSNIPFIYEILITKKFRPTWYWNYKEYKETLNFSAKRILSGLTTTGKPLLENSFFVSSLSYTELGFYNRAIGLATILIQKFSLQLTFAIYPVLTKVKPFTKQFRRISGLIIQFTAWFIIPLAYIVKVLNENLVVVLYGDNWLDVIPYLGLAAIIMALIATKHVIYSLLLSSHQEKICSIFDFVFLILSILTLLLVLPLGIMNYLYAQITLLFFSVLFLIIISTTKEIIKINDVYKSVLPPLLGILISHITCKVIFDISNFGNYPMLDLFVNGISLITVYVIVLRLLFKKDLISIINYLPFKKILMKILIITNDRSIK